MTGWIDAAAVTASHGYARYAEREEAGGSLRLEMPAREPEHRERAERHDDDLREPEDERRRPDEPGRREQDEERIDVAAEPGHLLARRAVRDLERAALGRAPDRLHHVPEVEAADAEVHEAVAHDAEEDDRPDGHRAPHDDRPGAVANGRERPRTRRSGARSPSSSRPSTASATAADGLRPARSDHSDRATVAAAIASVADVSNGVGCPLPGVTTIASGTNHTSERVRLRERDDDERAARSSAATRSA